MQGPCKSSTGMGEGMEGVEQSREAEQGGDASGQD